jgi:hypothetical protein
MIEQYSDGHIRIKGINYDKDVKIIEGDVVPNWWRKGGHRIEEEDIRDILDATPNILVVGTGYAENVHISQNVVSQAKARDIQLIPEPTPQAVKTFNRLLSEGRSVSGAFHLTC